MMLNNFEEFSELSETNWHTGGGRGFNLDAPEKLVDTDIKIDGKKLTIEWSPKFNYTRSGVEDVEIMVTKAELEGVEEIDLSKVETSLTNNPFPMFAKEAEYENGVLKIKFGS